MSDTESKLRISRDLEAQKQGMEEGCAACPIHHAANLKKLGVEMADWDFVVALAGNPN